MGSGMKKAKIPAGIRRGGPTTRSVQRDVDEPELEAPEQATPAGKTTSPALPRSDRERWRAASASSTATASTTASSKRGGGRTASAPAKRNPYAGQKRRPMNHLVYEGISGRLRELSEQLVAAGYPPRSASQAQLNQAILHFGMPADADAAAELIAQWTALTAVPPSNPYRAQKRKPMNHLIFEEIPARLGQLSEVLVEAGYSERSASQAQLTQAILHFGMPADRDEAGELLQRWILLTSAGSW
jgi:hypothetical protein